MYVDQPLSSLTDVLNERRAGIVKPSASAVRFARSRRAVVGPVGARRAVVGSRVRTRLIWSGVVRTAVEFARCHLGRPEVQELPVASPDGRSTTTVAQLLQGPHACGPDARAVMCKNYASSVLNMALMAHGMPPIPFGGSLCPSGYPGCGRWYSRVFRGRRVSEPGPSNSASLIAATSTQHRNSPLDVRRWEALGYDWEDVVRAMQRVMRQLPGAASNPRRGGIGCYAYYFWRGRLAQAAVREARLRRREARQHAQVSRVAVRR